MRTEAELREMIAALNMGLSMPCDCSGTKHALECAMGGKYMQLHRDALLWATGTALPPFERLLQLYRERN